MGLFESMYNQPPEPEPQRVDPELLRRLMALGTIAQRRGQLAQIQAPQVDYQHGRGLPLALSGLLSGLTQGLTAYKQKGLNDEQTQGRSALMGLVGNNPAMAAVASGDPVAGQVGQMMQAQPGMAAALRLHQAQAAHAEQQTRDAGPQEALGGQTPSVYEMLTKRQANEKPKVSIVPPGSSVVDARTGKPVGGAQKGPSDTQQIAEAIMNGQQPPDLKGMYRQGPAVRAYLAKQGFDLAGAQREWAGTQRHMATMNGQQQERLRQAVDFTSHSLDQIEQLYEEWKAQAPIAGIKVINRAALGASKQLGGDAGAAAQALESQINDFVGEYGNVLMGGNSPTDHALKLAAENLKGEWDDKTFKKAVGIAKNNLHMRQNAMNNSQTAGGSRYDAAPPSVPTPQPGAPVQGTVRKYNPATGKLE